MSNVPVYYL